MSLKNKLPVSYLLFTNRGRINRLTYWTASVFVWTSFYLLFNALQLISYAATWVIYPLLFWALISTATKRLHDLDKSWHWLWIILIPVAGPLVLIWFLGFKKGSVTPNRFGTVPGAARDYHKNGIAKQIVNDVTRLNPIQVAAVETPKTIAELQQIIRQSDKPVSVGGGRFSMGGQTASPGSLHLDLRKLNKVLAFSPENKTIHVEAGIRWCDIQHHIDAHDLSLKIMQTYANFTVGGSLSVNCHGRYIGLGPIILSVKSIEVVLADGTLQKASRTDNSELFYACIGCYNAVGVIATAELELTDNVPVKRVFKTMKRPEYQAFFFDNIRNRAEVVFHNADLYPPHFNSARAVSWVKTDEKPTTPTRLMPLSEEYPIERYFINAFSKSNFGKWRREHIIDPVFYWSKKIHWRNYEAGYDVAELEPESRKHSTFVLQEYFVPVHQFDAFAARMAEIFQRHRVNVLNVSVRHAHQDPGSLLAWAREEVFAYVVYYKQATNAVEKNKVAVWTRELIDAAISLHGAYYLPYQAHATREQFHAAYPNARQLFALKARLDPDFKFRNVLWDTYYAPEARQS